MAIKNFLYNFFLRIANIFKEENITEREGKSEVAESEKKLFFKHGEEKEQSVSLYTTKEEAGEKYIQIKINDEIFYVSLSEIKPEDFTSVLILESNGKRFYLTKAAEEPIGETPSEEPAKEPEEVPADKVFDNTQTFTSSGTFTVPEGVTVIYVTASAGGGGGGAAPYVGQQVGMMAPPVDGQNGGNTSFDDLLTLSGGGGAKVQGKTLAPGENKSPNSISNSYGNGAASGFVDCKGGRGENCTRKMLKVTSNKTYNITIGAGGAGGKHDRVPQGADILVPGTPGQAGQPGFMTIEWDTPTYNLILAGTTNQTITLKYTEPGNTEPKTITSTSSNIVVAVKHGTTWTATITAKEGYNPGTLSADSGTVISETTVSASEAELKDKIFENSKIFTSSDTFTVPDGVTEIYVTASAGGGGGGGGPIWEVRAPVPAPRPINPGTNGTSGGNTIIDSLLTLNGGGGGTACDGYNNTHSANGKSYDNKIENDTYKNYGNGGNGAEHPNGTYKAGTGGKGENCYKTKITVSPGQKISITIGQGGTGGTGSYPGTMPDNVKNGSNGQSGFALIEWDTPKAKEIESKTITIDMDKEWWTCPEGVNNIEIKESSTAKELIIKVTAGYKYKFGYKSEAYYDSDGIVCEEDYLLIENNHSHQDEINFYSTSYPGDEGDDNSYVTYKLIITYSPEINKKTPKYSAD